MNPVKVLIQTIKVVKEDLELDTVHAVVQDVLQWSEDNGEGTEKISAVADLVDSILNSCFEYNRDLDDTELEDVKRHLEKILEFLKTYYTIH